MAISMLEHTEVESSMVLELTFIMMRQVRDMKVIG
jgi:hypothetical protein